MLTYDSAGSWSFVNGFPRNFIIFGIDDHSSPHSHNCKNNFLMLGESATFGVNGSFVSPEKRFSNNFSISKKQILLEFAL